MSLTLDDALQREQAITSLNQRLLTDRIRARAAMLRIAARITAGMEELVLKYLRPHVDTRSLLPIAKQLLLDPARMMQPCGEDLASSSGGIDPADPVIALRPTRVWHVKAYRAIGRFDIGVVHTVENLAGHLRNALQRGFGVVNRSPTDAYAYALTQVWAQGRQHYDGACAFWRGTPSEFPAATPVVPLRDLVLEEIRSKPDRVRVRDEWIHTVIVMLFALDPEFDGVAHGLEQPIEWEPDGFKDIFIGRARIKQHVEMAEPGFQARALGLCQQALVVLDRPTQIDGSPGPRGSGQGAAATPVFGVRARRTIVLLQSRTPQEPITGPELVDMYVRRWPSDKTLTPETWRGSVLKEIRACTFVQSVHKKGYWLAADSPARSWRFSDE